MTKESKGLGTVNSGSGAVAHSGGVGAGQGGVAIGGNLYGDLHLHGSSASPPKPRSESGIFFGVPELPPNYLPRKEYLEEFRTALQQNSIGLTGAAHVGVQGMGGLGKSVLAIALARDEDVQAAFPGGIFWFTFGQEVKDDDLLAWQNTILKLLGQQEPEESIDFSRHRLNAALRDKCCLFIIDDIWDSRHLKCFDLSGTDCRFLLTSRKADVLERLGIEGKPIELLSEEQALAMLARYSAYDPDELPEEAVEIVKECGYLPLAVAAIGSMVKRKPANRWKLALHKLQEAKLDKIAFKFDYQYENLFRALQVSVEALPAVTQKYYATLAVFPEDAKIPESAVTMYWEHCRLSDDEPLDVIDALVDASLLSRDEYDALQLHDLLRDYLIKQTKDIAGLHKQLLDAYQAAYPGGWHTIPYESPCYFYNHWHFHSQIADEMAQASIIADDIIKHQSLLDLEKLRVALQFVNYNLEDIVYQLVKTNHHQDVLITCLNILGDEAKDEALRLLKEDKYPNLTASWLKRLGGEAKEEARNLLRKSQNSQVVVACLNLLGEEAKEKARNLLRKSQNSQVLVTCLDLLGKEAKEEARNLLKRSHNPHVLFTCLNLLGIEAKDEARFLLSTSNNKQVKRACLSVLGEEAKEEARYFLRESKHPMDLICCLKALGNDAKDEARLLILSSNNKRVLNTCLKILGEELKEDAHCFLKECKHPTVLSACLNALGDKAKKEARWLLKSRKNGGLLLTCIRILGKEAKAEAELLIKTSSDRLILKECRELIRFWETSLGSQFPELDQLRKKLADK